MALATSGPATIQRSRELGLSVRPTAQPSPMMQVLSSSCAWSIAIVENTYFAYVEAACPEYPGKIWVFCLEFNHANQVNRDPPTIVDAD